MNSPRSRARVVCGGTDLASKIFRSVVTRATAPALLEQVVEPAAAVDVVVGEVELGDPGVAERQPVLGAVAVDQLPLDDPVDLALDQAEVVGLDRLEAALPQVEGPLDDRRARSRGGRRSRGPWRGTRAGCRARSPRGRWPAGPCAGRSCRGEISRIARIGFSIVRSRITTPSSIIRSTRSQLATLSIVVVSLMLESPTMTCSRRKRSASACGSSRVLMIGRDRVVALRDALPDVLGALADGVRRAARRSGSPCRRRR